MSETGSNILGGAKQPHDTPIWSGHAIWANYVLDLNIFPRSRNAHLSEWGKQLSTGWRINEGEPNLTVNVRIFYSRSSWSSSGLHFITEDVKKAFFGDGSVRQSVHIVMKQTDSSSNFVAHVEGSSAYILGFTIVPYLREETRNPLRPLVIDLKSESVIRSGEYFYFKAWILNENSILPFFRFVALKAESRVENDPYQRPILPGSEWFSYLNHHSISPFLNPSQVHQLTTVGTALYDNFQRLQSDISNKYVHNLSQKPVASSSSVIKPIPIYPSNESHMNLVSELQGHNLRETNNRLEFSHESMFKANNVEGYFQSIGKNVHHSFSPNKMHPSPKSPHSQCYSTKDHKTPFYSQDGRPKSSGSSSSTKEEANVHSSLNSLKNSQSPSIHEKYLSEFINTLFTLQEDSNQTLNLLDKIVPLLIGPEGEERNLLEKVHDLFRAFYKNQSPENEAFNVKIELQFANTLMRCPYNFRQDLATHFLRERDVLLLKQKRREMKHHHPNKLLSDTIVRSEEYTLKKKTIGVFSGNFNDHLVHFSTIILENVSVPPGSSSNSFSNLYCLFISKSIPFFSWDKWKDSNVLLKSSFSKMTLSFNLEDSEKFNLSVKYMESPEDFDEYISSISSSGSVNSRKAAIISFTNFYNYFQKIEKLYKVEPLITWKPIIFSKPSMTTPSSKESTLKKNKEQDPFYGLLMSVFGNRVYGLSYRKRIKLKFDFKEKQDIIYHALVFNNNIVFISEATAADFLKEIDNLIFGCETFETFLIKNDRIPTSGISVLKLKIPITSRKANPLRDSMGNTTNIIPSVLVKAKILNINQLNNLDFLKMEIFDGESFIVERKQSLVTFQNTLRGHIKSDERDVESSSMDFRMMRKIRAIAKMRVFMRNTFHDLILFYLISFTKSEGSELVFLNNSENEIIGRNIDVLISPLSENMLRLVTKSNFSSSVLLTRKDKSTWAMITDINEPLRCIGRIVMPNTYKSIIWEAIESKDMFFSDMGTIRSSFSSFNKTCMIRSWEKLYSINDEAFNDFHLGEEYLQSWDTSLDSYLAPSSVMMKEVSKKPKRKKNNNETLKGNEGDNPPPSGSTNDSPCDKKQRSDVVEETMESPPKVDQEVAMAMPLKKRLIRPHSRSSTLSSCSSPPLLIDIDCETQSDDAESMDIKESEMVPKVVIHENERNQAERYLSEGSSYRIPSTVEKVHDKDEEVIDAIKCIVDDIEHNRH